MNTKDSLIIELNNLGLKPGDLVMLHASIRAVGKTLGGPDQTHQAVIDTIGSNGTLMMYVGCEPEYEAVGRGQLPQQEEKLLLEKCPVFDAKTARARRDYGILAEFFCSWPGVICSENPGARIAAFGKNADYYVLNHPLDYGYGPGSPLAKLYENEGKLLLLGSDLDQVTLLHYAEHIASIENKRIKKFKVPLLKNTERVWINIEEYDTSIGIREWPDRFFENIVKKFIQKNNIKPSTVGYAKSYLLNAKQLVDFAVLQFEEEAKRC
jgi:aminoglycoside 3-N-acetyltransferase